jgi:hypothetical protein
MIKQWIDECNKDHSHVLILTDLGHNESHHKVLKTENINDLIDHYRKNRIVISKIINLKMDIQDQLDAFKPYNK